MRLWESGNREAIPKLAQSVSGGIVHAHTRDPFLASLPKEALQALARTYDDLLAKHVPNGSQDGPQNQVNSSTAIEKRKCWSLAVLNDDLAVDATSVESSPRKGLSALA